MQNQKLAEPSELEYQIKNYSVINEDIAASGTLTDLGVIQAKNSGFQTIIDLRMPQEGTEIEEAQTTDLGMDYYNIPMNASGIPEGAVDQLAKILDGAKKPILLHCAGAVRVGAIWTIYRITKQAIDSDIALIEGRKIGMTEAFEEVIRSQYPELF